MRKPAYSKHFYPLDCATFKVAVVFYGSDSWMGKDSPIFSSYCLVIPPAQNPFDFDWSALRGCLVYGSEQGASSERYREDLAIACLLAGAVFFKTFAQAPIVIERKYGYAA